MRRMRARTSVSATTAALFVALSGCSLKHHGGAHYHGGCPPDSKLVGTLCVDKYEASIWQIDPSKTGLIDKVKHGTATKADLTAGNATLMHPADNPGNSPALAASGFPDNGNWTKPFYAASIEGVYPTEKISWFQAAQACALSGKRLLTNQEWQVAAAGTPDPGPNDGTTNHKCNTGTAEIQEHFRPSGRAGVKNDMDPLRDFCVSNWGIEDMVGNMEEFVAEWGQRSDIPLAGGFLAPYSDDGKDDVRIDRMGHICFGGCNGRLPCKDDAPCKTGNCGTQAQGRCGSQPGEPAAFRRGGSAGEAQYAGVFSLTSGADSPIWGGGNGLGFRCARERGH